MIRFQRILILLPISILFWVFGMKLSADFRQSESRAQYMLRMLEDHADKLTLGALLRPVTETELASGSLLPQWRWIVSRGVRGDDPLEILVDFESWVPGHKSTPETRRWSQDLKEWAELESQWPIQDADAAQLLLRARVVFAEANSKRKVHRSEQAWVQDLRAFRFARAYLRTAALEKEAPEAYFIATESFLRLAESVRASVAPEVLRRLFAEQFAGTVWARKTQELLSSR